MRVLGVVGHTIISVLKKASERRYWYLGKTGVGERDNQENTLQAEGTGQIQRCAGPSVHEEQTQGN